MRYKCNNCKSIFIIAGSGDMLTHMCAKCGHEMSNADDSTNDVQSIRIKKLTWDDHDKVSTAIIFNGQLTYSVDLTNANKLLYPPAGIRFENCFDTISYLDFDDTWTMDECKEVCQKHFEEMIKSYIH